MFYSYIKFIAKGHLHCREPFSKGAQSHNSVHVLRQNTGSNAWRKKWIGHRIILSPKLRQTVTSARGVERRIQRITGLSAWPPCQVRSWLSRSFWVPIWGMWWTTRGSGPTRMGWGKTGSVWLIWFPSMTCLVDGDVVHLDLSKAFGTVPSILPEKLAAHGWDRGTLHWVKNFLGGQALRMVGNEVTSSQQPVTNGVPRAQHWGQSFSCLYPWSGWGNWMHLQPVCKWYQMWCGCWKLKSRKSLQTDLDNLNWWAD